MPRPGGPSEHFKRVAVAVYNAPDLKRMRNPTRAIRAVNIAFENSVKYSFATKPSLARGARKMAPTSRGRRRGRTKAGDSTHARKMRLFEKIWAIYTEATNEKGVPTSKHVASVLEAKAGG